VLSDRRRLLLVNKKKQENLFPLGRAGFSAAGSEEQEFFAPFFCRKTAAFLFQAQPGWPWLSKPLPP
jgi:hypothetical protein